MAASLPPRFLASEGGLHADADSLFHLLPVPFERTVSYGHGTAGGPRAILEASQQLEAWDGASTPLELGIHTTPFVDCTGETGSVLQRVTDQCAAIMRQAKVPVLLGGEHTITLGALQAGTEVYHGSIGLFQLDAHADLRDSYEGDSLSHACVARRAHSDYQVKICQFGVRALSREEHLYRREHGISHFDAADLHRSGPAAFRLPDDFPELVYLSLDVDGLDPSVIRSTGTPVPGGPGWHETIEALAAVIQGRSVIGFDVVELAPRQDDHASCFAAALLCYTVMGLIQRLEAFPPTR